MSYLFWKLCLYCECDSFSDCIVVYNLDIFMLFVSSFALVFLNSHLSYFLAYKSLNMSGSSFSDVTI